MPSTRTAALPDLSRQIRSRLERADDLPARLDRPNLPAARESAAVFWDCFQSLSVKAGVAASIAQAIDIGALYRSFDAFLLFRAGKAAATARALLDVWSSTSLARLRALEGAEPEMVSFATALREELEPVQDELTESLYAAAERLFEQQEWLVVFHQAVEQIVASELGAAQSRAALRSLMARLELSQDDLGRMFGVSGETIRRWERGVTSIPAQRSAEILAAESGLRRLQDLFRPERLAAAIRRSAELFNGESALEWILRGRIAEVADRYEQALLYQA